MRGVDVVGERQGDNVGLRPSITARACLPNRRATLDADRLVGLGLPLFCEGRIQVGIELSGWVMGDVEQRIVCACATVTKCACCRDMDGDATDVFQQNSWTVRRRVPRNRRVKPQHYGRCTPWGKKEIFVAATNSSIRARRLASSALAKLSPRHDGHYHPDTTMITGMRAAPGTETRACWHALDGGSDDESHRNTWRPDY